MAFIITYEEFCFGWNLFLLKLLLIVISAKCIENQHFNCWCIHKSNDRSNSDFHLKSFIFAFLVVECELLLVWIMYVFRLLLRFAILSTLLVLRLMCRQQTFDITFLSWMIAGKCCRYHYMMENVVHLLGQGLHNPQLWTFLLCIKNYA